jgi:hypothetical protein
MLSNQFVDGPSEREVKERQYRILSAETYELMPNEETLGIKDVTTDANCDVCENPW